MSSVSGMYASAYIRSSEDVGCDFHAAAATVNSDGGGTNVPNT